MPIEKWSIDGYIAVQLMCCFSWRLGRIHGYDDKKLAMFHEGIAPELKPKLQNTINSLQNELLQDVNRSVYEDLPIFARMIPKEYRQEAWQRCRGILSSNPTKQDELIYNALKKALS